MARRGSGGRSLSRGWTANSRGSSILLPLWSELGGRKGPFPPHAALRRNHACKAAAARSVAPRWSTGTSEPPPPTVDRPFVGCDHPSVPVKSTWRSVKSTLCT